MGAEEEKSNRQNFWNRKGFGFWISKFLGLGVNTNSNFFAAAD